MNVRSLTNYIVLGGAFLLFLNPLASAQQISRYSGAVGKLDAVFELSWKRDGSVVGAYAHPSRPGVVYTLSGSNYKEGHLYLEEYTGRKLTARCELRKELTDGKIVWKGTMNNTDGRRFGLWFSRNRDGGKKNVLRLPNSTSKYTGRIGVKRYRAIFSWYDDQSVAGYFQRDGDDPSMQEVLSFQGNNYAEGKLQLHHMVNGKVAGTIRLQKRVVGGVILWEGVYGGKSFRFGRDKQGPIWNLPGDEDLLPKKEVLVTVKPAQHWANPPRRKVDIDFQEWNASLVEWFRGRVIATRYLNNQLTVSFALDNTEDLKAEFLEVRIPSSREVTLKVAYPDGENPFVEGSRVSLSLDKDGNIGHLYLGEIAITHWRESKNDDRIEVRGFRWNEEALKKMGVEFDEYTVDVLTEEELKNVEFLELIPDKLGLDKKTTNNLTWRSIEFDSVYGLSVRVESAGPGEISLERISVGLDKPAARPWNSVQERQGGTLVPPTQKTTDAG